MRYMIRFLFILLAFSQFSVAKSVPETMPTLAPVLKKAMPAIVNISVQGYIPAPETAAELEKRAQRGLPLKRRKFTSIGSGVVIDPKNGIIITNDHVIRNASLVTVTIHDGRRLKAKIIGSDMETDLAVLKIDAKNLESLPFADSDRAQVGDFVIAIGNPFGLNSYGNSQSATFGIISALKRSDLNIEGVENFIQTDAAINPGNSGGALVTAKGELIGINTAILSPFGGNVGIGFAIPVNMAREVVQQILRYGSVHRGLMGIFVQPLTPELAGALGYNEDLQGALVSQVNENSPAEKAGLKAGDIITKINETLITQASNVKITTSLLRAGSEAKIYVKRDGKALVLNTVVTDLKEHEQKLQSENPFLFGLALENFEQETPLHGNVRGVQIVGASETSSGWRSGIRPGDVVISANKKPVSDVKALQKIAKEKNDRLLLQIVRGPGSLFVLVS